jgi:hypothetical protein
VDLQTFRVHGNGPWQYQVYQNVALLCRENVAGVAAVKDAALKIRDGLPYKRAHTRRVVHVIQADTDTNIPEHVTARKGAKVTPFFPRLSDPAAFLVKLRINDVHSLMEEKFLEKSFIVDTNMLCVTRQDVF